MRQRVRQLVVEDRLLEKFLLLRKVVDVADNDQARGQPVESQSLNLNFNDQVLNA